MYNSVGGRYLAKVCENQSRQYRDTPNHLLRNSRMTTLSVLHVPSLHEQHGCNPRSSAQQNHTPTRPATLPRTFSTPPISPASQAQDFRDEVPLQKSHFSVVRDLLTPPASPLTNYDAAPSSALETPIKLIDALPHSSSLQSKPSRDALVAQQDLKSLPSPEQEPILEYPYQLELARDECGKTIMFGSGAWSTVSKAVSRPNFNSIPGGRSRSSLPLPSRSPLVVAVKTPHRKDGYEIIKSEAQILSHLVKLPYWEEHIVPFHGYISSTSSIVLSAIPLGLSDHITNCTLDLRSMAPSHARTAPVIGSEQMWLSLAGQLIDSLAWLHEVAGIVHGDIKPHNILLRPIELSDEHSDSQFFPYVPLIIDFSSSCHLHSRTRSPGALSAVTREYTAPELLRSSVLRDPTSLPTTASDVFSLAVTLLVAATGDLDVYPATSPFQRQAMASQGWSVIGFARNGAGGARVPRFGTVERCLERAVLKDGMGRVDAPKWAQLIQDVMKGEPMKKAS